VTAIDGPVSVVQLVLAAVSAEIAPPPVAGVTVPAAQAGATNGASEPAPISPVRSPASKAGRGRREGDALITDPPGVDEPAGVARRLRGCVARWRDRLAGPTPEASERLTCAIQGVRPRCNTVQLERPV
jgi:hypothetical protein